MQGQHVVFIILHGVKGNSLTQANLEPKTKIYIYIFFFLYCQTDLDTLIQVSELCQ